MKNVSSNPRICKMCEVEFLPTSNRQLYCLPCQKEKNRISCREYRKRTFIPKGYNQKGENNNNWKGGIGTYRILAKEVGHCERCKATERLLVHHKDRNRYNNDRTNLEVLCKRCHQLEHECWKQLPQYR